jgi:hypothetical protein
MPEEEHTVATQTAERQKVTAEEHVEILGFYARQCRLMDALKIEEFADTFTEDGVIDHAHRGERLAGRDAMVAAMRAALPRYRSVVPRHWFDHYLVEKTADGDLVVTDDGRLLARIYSESDLLVAECLRSGTWNGLDAAELAGVVSAVLFESRGDTPGSSSVVEGATPGMRRALSQTRRSWAEIHAEEQQHRLPASREPDVGFVAAIHRWASTGDLSASLAASDASGNGSPLSAGDFVRWCRQVLDLLDQVRNAAPTPALRTSAKRAIDAIRRGVVAVDAG